MTVGIVIDGSEGVSVGTGLLERLIVGRGTTVDSQSEVHTEVIVTVGMGGSITEFISPKQALKDSV